MAKQKRGKRALTAFTLMSVAMLAWWVAAPAAQAPSKGRNSAATITGAFADSCRDFAVRSSKDISHVEIHYFSGPVIKDENINSREHAIDGGAGDEIEFAIVKSGTTSEEFPCVPSNRAPTALLEIQTPEDCYEFWAGGLRCEQSTARTVWTSTSQIPDNGGHESGWFRWGCGFVSHSSLCAFAISFRGTGSTDPDRDITNWSLDFGDGTSVSGNWDTAPPEVVHEYTRDGCRNVPCVITLTVTDSAGQSDSDVMVMYFLDETPD